MIQNPYSICENVSRLLTNSESREFIEVSREPMKYTEKYTISLTVVGIAVCAVKPKEVGDEASVENVYGFGNDDDRTRSWSEQEATVQICEEAGSLADRDRIPALVFTVVDNDESTAEELEA